MDLAQEKILVTGGAGFLGRHVLEQLLARGVSRENVFAPSAAELDLTVRRDCEKAVEGRAVVIHAAAVTGNAELHRAHPADIFHDNALMGTQLLKAASEAGVKKIVTIGSVTEYPDVAPLPLRENDLWGGYPEATHAPYSIAKRALLTYGQACRVQYGISVIHLLMTSMYGPGAAPGSGPVPSFIERIAEAKRSGGKEITAWGTGKPLRDLLYVSDAAEAIVAATEKYDGSEPVNIGSGTEISIADLVAHIIALMDFKGGVIFDPTKPDGKMRRALDVTRAEKEFGFRAETDLESGLRKTIEWYNSQI
jgi:GDP-L-fucose synthase